MSLEGVSTDSL